MPPRTGANSLVSIRIRMLAASMRRARHRHAARILNLAVVAKNTGELPSRREVGDRARYPGGVHLAGSDRISYRDESLDKRVGNIPSCAVSRDQKAVVAVADGRFELRQMHRDDRPANR